MPLFTIKCTCPKCKKSFEQNTYLHAASEIIEGGSIDTDCDYCGSVIDDTNFEVVGVWNYRTCETEYRPKDELVKIYWGTFKIKHGFRHKVFEGDK